MNTQSQHRKVTLGLQGSNDSRTTCTRFQLAKMHMELARVEHGILWRKKN